MHDVSRAGFARFMETDEPAAPQRSAHVHPDAVAVHIPSSLSAEADPAAFRVSGRPTVCMQRLLGLTSLLPSLLGSDHECEQFCLPGVCVGASTRW
jgi:hypothetical protein